MHISSFSLYFLATLFIITLLAVGIIFYPYLDVFILSLVLGVIFRPMHDKILNAVKIPGLAAAISTVAVLIIMLGPVALIGSQLFSEARDLYVRMQNNNLDLGLSLSILENKIDNLFPHLEINLQGQIKNILQWLLGSVSATFFGATQAFVSIFLSIIALYYWFKEGRKMKDYVIRLSPMPDSYDKDIINKLSTTVHSIIRGSIVMAIIQGFLSGLGFYIFGIPNPVLRGTATLISSLVPTVGTALVIVPAIIYLLFSGNVLPAVGLTIWGSIAVGLIDNFLGPKLMSQGSKLHPFFILISVLGGIRLLGPIGFVAGPLAVSLLFSLLDIYLYLKSNSKETS